MPARATAAPSLVLERPRLEVLTVQEAAAELKVSPKTITRRFRDLPGVLDVGSGKHQELRIPRRVFDEWVAARSRGFFMEPGKGRV